MKYELMQFIIGFAVFFWVIGLGVGILIIIATWKLYEKAGEPGWASLVPFYRDYVMFKVSWGNGWYFLLSKIPSILYLIFYIPFCVGMMNGLRSGYLGNGAYPFGNFNMMSNIAGFSVLIFLFSTAMLVISIITCIKLAKAFGQGGGFACGLIFLSPVFLCIIAFSKNIYYVGIPGKMPPYGQPSYSNPSAPFGHQPNWQNPYYQPNGYQRPDDLVKYCTGCGAPMKTCDTYCPRCGKPQ